MQVFESCSVCVCVYVHVHRSTHLGLEGCWRQRQSGMQRRREEQAEQRDVGSELYSMSRWGPTNVRIASRPQRSASSSHDGIGSELQLFLLGGAAAAGAPDQPRDGN